MRIQYSGLLKEASARTLAAGDLEAVFLPGHGMLGASLRHKGVEILRRVEDLEAAAARGSSAGIPLLYPWANRLSARTYAVDAETVTLAPDAYGVRADNNGLPIHGLLAAYPGWRCAWTLRSAQRSKTRLSVRAWR